MVPIPHFAGYRPVLARRVSPYELETIGIAKPPNVNHPDEVYLVRTHYRNGQDPVHPSTHNQPDAVCLYQLKADGKPHRRPKHSGFLHHYPNHPPTVLWLPQKMGGTMPTYLMADAHSALAHAKHAHLRLPQFQTSV